MIVQQLGGRQTLQFFLIKTLRIIMASKSPDVNVYILGGWRAHVRDKRVQKLGSEHANTPKLLEHLLNSIPRMVIQ
jgi:hypothetical protein